MRHNGLVLKVSLVKYTGLISSFIAPNLESTYKVLKPVPVFNFLTQFFHLGMESDLIRFSCPETNVPFYLLNLELLSCRGLIIFPSVKHCLSCQVY